MSDVTACLSSSAITHDVTKNNNKRYNNKRYRSFKSRYACFAVLFRARRTSMSGRGDSARCGKGLGEFRLPAALPRYGVASVSTDTGRRLGRGENRRRRRLPAALTRNSFNWTLTRPATRPKTHETNFYRGTRGILENGAPVDSAGTAKRGEMREEGRGGSEREGENPREPERRTALIPLAAFRRNNESK